MCICRCLYPSMVCAGVEHHYVRPNASCACWASPFLAQRWRGALLTGKHLQRPQREYTPPPALPFANDWSDSLLLSDQSFANGGAVLRARCCCSLVIVLCVFQKTNFKKSHAFDYRSGTPIEFDVPAKEDAGGSPSRLQSRQSYAASERDNTRSQV